ncbi:hypothetical protein [Campylobacter curvus]|uniref:hypothetical protein n=1 Tax=Campylobacter curvus TaxID=200 RepID=UPI00036E5909|nr:hypothetical protein [Campylobacter curvus]QKF62150.1 hypothetical protein CCVT_1912 [Campylobacter curvus]UEB50438.1 hypothetical protein LK426_03000 [Campylobacter curvus]
MDADKFESLEEAILHAKEISKTQMPQSSQQVLAFLFFNNYKLNIKTAIIVAKF